MQDELKSNDSEHMNRTLGLKDIIALGIGAVLGSGIFVTVGIAAAGGGDHIGAGPAIALSFIVAAIASFFCALCYAELASMIPIAGSAYTYAYATLGEFIAWIIGWDLILEYSVGNIATAIPWGSYFGSLMSSIGIDIPVWLLKAPCTLTPEEALAAPQLFGWPFACNLPAIAIMAILTIVLIKGIRESATFNDILVIIKILLVLFVIGITVSYVDPQNWHPFMPNGWMGVQAGAAVLFYCYVGFDAMSTCAEETKNPGRTLPLGMMWTLGICTVLYVAVALVFTGVVPYWKFANCADPMAYILTYINKPWASAIVSIGTLIAMTAVLLVFQIGQPRIFMSMARDGLLPQSFERLHPKYKTPHITTIWCGVLVGLSAGFLDLGIVLDLCIIGTLFSLMLVCLGVIIMRHSRPDAVRPFRTPLVPLVPILGIVCCLGLIFAMPTAILKYFAIWLGIGAAVYFCYGIKHSRLNYGGQNCSATGGDGESEIASVVNADLEVPAE